MAVDPGPFQRYIDEMNELNREVRSANTGRPFFGVDRSVVPRLSYRYSSWGDKSSTSGWTREYLGFTAEQVEEQEVQRVRRAAAWEGILALGWVGKGLAAAFSDDVVLRGALVRYEMGRG